MNELKIAVISDIHASDQDGEEARTHVRTSPPSGQPLRDPLRSLDHLLDDPLDLDEPIRADVLLCAGDMTNQARPAALEHAWNALVRFREKLGASALVATAGNHDLDSRFSYTDHDTRGVMLELEPSFPAYTGARIVDFNTSNHYWARDYAVVKIGACRIVTINSAAFHGVGDQTHMEWKHGRVTSRTVARLRRTLAAEPAPALNVLLCHHHPFRIGDVDLDDYSEMRGGEELIELLRSGNFGRWLVIHGHKHYARMTYGPGGSNAPLVLSAGSLGADLYGELSGRTSNQFYLVRCRLDAAEELGMSLAGTVDAWDWAPNIGWRPATSGLGLPNRSGFGHIPDIPGTVQQIAHISEAAPAYLSWNEVCQTYPKLAYLIPEDEAALAEALRRSGVEVLSPNGKILQIRGGSK